MVLLCERNPELGIPSTLTLTNKDISDIRFNQGQLVVSTSRNEIVLFDYHLFGKTYKLPSDLSLEEYYEIDNFLLNVVSRVLFLPNDKIAPMEVIIEKFIKQYGFQKVI